MSEGTDRYYYKGIGYTVSIKPDGTPYIVINARLRQRLRAIADVSILDDITGKNAADVMKELFTQANRTNDT